MNINSADWIGKKIFVETEEDDEQVCVNQIGRIHFFVFDGLSFVGVLIKRPDVAMMFRRKDIFVSCGNFYIADDTFIVKADYDSKSKKFLRDRQIKLDCTVVWDGMDVKTQSGEFLGAVDCVSFDTDTAEVDSILVSAGATSNALLGKREIPKSLLCGFSDGGVKLVRATDASSDTSGFILVSDEAKDIPLSGGAVTAAAKTSVAASVAAKKAAHDFSESAKPKIENAKVAAGDLSVKAASAVGKKYEESKLGILGFGREFKNALNESRDDDSSDKQD